MKLLCQNCNTEIESKTNKPRLCNNCRNRVSNLFSKLSAIYYKGSKCEECGWSGNPLGFDFHHFDPNEKEFEMNQLFKKRNSWNKIKKELDKCQLLCTTCHRNKHSSPLSDIPFLAYLDKTTKIRFYTDWIDEETLDSLNNKIQCKKLSKKYITANYICQNPLCQKSFTKSHKTKNIPKYCSLECIEKYDTSHKKYKNIPDKEALLEMKKTMSWTQIANEYGISRRAIYKWRKKYNMISERKLESQSLE